MGMSFWFHIFPLMTRGQLLMHLTTADCNFLTDVSVPQAHHRSVAGDTVSLRYSMRDV